MSAAALQREEVPFTREQIQAAERKFQEAMSPAGALGLPKLLDAKRLEFLMPDIVFETECVFDRILLWQTTKTVSEYFEGSRLIKPELSKHKEKESTPMGVIVSAGLKALDNLRSNGIDLGHTVRFVKMGPWRMPMGTVNGHQIELVVLRDGDIISSDDLRTALKDRSVRRIERELDGGVVEHVFCDDKGKIWHPAQPVLQGDY